MIQTMDSMIQTMDSRLCSGLVSLVAMPTLVVGIHVFRVIEDVDGRDRPGHDGEGCYGQGLQ